MILKRTVLLFTDWSICKFIDSIHLIVFILF